MNPLARSRLEAALSDFSCWKNDDQGIMISWLSDHEETLRAAIDALLNPKVTNDLALNPFTNKSLVKATERKRLYSTMIAELTKESL